MAQKKALQWKPTRSCFKLFICLNGFLFVLSLCLKLPYLFLVEAVGHDSTPTLHCILLCPFSSYFVVPVVEKNRECR